MSDDQRLGIRCMQMRGGSSKGAYFLGADLPADPAERDDLLLRIMGSPDPRQVDGIGGGHPLTSKVAVVTPSAADGADVDYLFLQVIPDQATVSAAQTCGNLLAGVGPFAIERGLVAPTDRTTAVRIRIVNPTPSFAEARVQTPGGRVRYDGDTVMAGAPVPAAPIQLSFPGGDRSCFPTGRLVDRFDGVAVTCVDAGMPVVLVRAGELGIDGTEAPDVLERDGTLRSRVEAIRRQAGPAMGLGDVEAGTVPKISIVSAPRHGGTVATRTFIPHRVHTAIGVLGAVSVAVAVRTSGTVADQPGGAVVDQPGGAVADQPGGVVADQPGGGGLVRVEHPSGIFDVQLELAGAGADTRVRTSAVVRTARKLSDGLVWPRSGRATG